MSGVAHVAGLDVSVTKFDALIDPDSVTTFDAPIDLDAPIDPILLSQALTFPSSARFERYCRWPHG